MEWGDITGEELIRRTFTAVDVNAEFTEATLKLADGSRLCFRHRVGKRRAWADGGPGLAGLVLSRIARFRLNGKHLELTFDDGTQWELRFRG